MLLWKWARFLCCGCERCWCQLCGACGVGHKDCETQLVLSNGELQLDYVTFEPYGECFPRILVVRDSRVASFREHTGMLSNLSNKYWGVFLNIGCCHSIS